MVFHGEEAYLIQKPNSVIVGRTSECCGFVVLHSVQTDGWGESYPNYCGISVKKPVKIRIHEIIYNSSELASNRSHLCQRLELNTGFVVPSFNFLKFQQITC